MGRVPDIGAHAARVSYYSQPKDSTALGCDSAKRIGCAKVNQRRAVPLLSNSGTKL
jgi:hypothetical protein